MITATTTCIDLGSSTECLTQTAQHFYNGFSSGEILIVFLLIILTIQILFYSIKSFIYN
jgi:hypothetical protein